MLTGCSGGRALYLLRKRLPHEERHRRAVDNRVRTQTKHKDESRKRTKRQDKQNDKSRELLKTQRQESQTNKTTRQTERQESRTSKATRVERRRRWVAASFQEARLWSPWSTRGVPVEYPWSTRRAPREYPWSIRGVPRGVGVGGLETDALPTRSLRPPPSPRDSRAPPGAHAALMRRSNGARGIREKRVQGCTKGGPLRARELPVVRAGVLNGYSTGSHRVLTGYSRVLDAVLTGYSTGTRRGLTGYSRVLDGY